MKKNKTKSGQKGKKIKPYKYSEQLGFLVAFLEERETLSNIDSNTNPETEERADDVSDDEPIGYSQNEVNNHSTSTEPQNNGPSTSNAPVAITTESQSNVSSKPGVPTNVLSKPVVPTNVSFKPGASTNVASKPKTPPAPQNNIPPKKLKTNASNIPQPKTAAATLMEYLVQKKENDSAQSQTAQHPVDAFLSGIAPALKNLPPRYWYFAKAEIFEAVQKYEYKLLVDKQEVLNPSVAQFCTPSMYSGQPGSSPQYSNVPSPVPTHYSNAPSPAAAGSYQQSTSTNDLRRQSPTHENYALQQFFHNYSDELNEN